MHPELRLGEPLGLSGQLQSSSSGHDVPQHIAKRLAVYIRGGLPNDALAQVGPRRQIPQSQDRLRSSIWAQARRSQRWRRAEPGPAQCSSGRKRRSPRRGRVGVTAAIRIDRCDRRSTIALRVVADWIIARQIVTGQIVVQRNIPGHKAGNRIGNGTRCRLAYLERHGLVADNSDFDLAADDWASELTLAPRNAAR